jgi:type I restriction-modification system DNA methylase subunit
MAKPARVAEVRAEHLLTELLTSQGWNVEHPPKGELLRQGEYKDHPHLLDIFKGKSKSSGGGDGMPEALLVDENLQPLAVVEVKGSEKDLPKAIDEVTNNYGTWCVEAGYTPLAIALAGTTETSFGLRVFKWSKNKWLTVTYDGNPINWIPNRPDLEHLRTPNTLAELRPSVPPVAVLATRADEINRLLREANITDAQRPAIVGSIMLALWKSKGQIRRDPEYILGDINEASQKAFWTAEKASIADSLHVPVANKDLAKSAVRIVSILERLGVTVLSAETDYLGQLYETFFTYVGGNTIGQIFTPRHMTAFMAELADVQRDDDVLDPACGTGGFLIAAMNRVQQRGKLSRAQMIEIVKKHLVGFEVEPITAALCIANMVLRGDGSTRVHWGSCFTSKKFEAGKANIVLMNPPFPHESTDKPPEEFIARALEGLKTRGLFVAIVPQSLLVKRPKQQWRDNILRQHTLNGVITLPDELFQPFAAATTAILILEKGIPHSSDRRVFFARVENDGFRLKKGVRIPREGAELPIILDAYRNKKAIPGISGLSVLDRDRSFAPGAYIPARPLSEAEVTAGVLALIRNRTAFTTLHAAEIVNLRREASSYRAIKKSPIPSAPTSKTIGGYFDIFYGQKSLHNKEKLLPGTSLVISSSGVDNGCYGFFDLEALIEPPFVTVPSTGSIAVAHVQELPCGVTDDCLIMLPKKDVPHELLYIAAAVIRSEAWRFSYGRKATPDRIAGFPLPVGKDLIECVRIYMERAAQVEHLALEHAEDAIDEQIARVRLDDIKTGRTKLVGGDALAKRLADLE